MAKEQGAHKACLESIPHKQHSAAGYIFISFKETLPRTPFPETSWKGKSRMRRLKGRIWDIVL